MQALSDCLIGESDASCDENSPHARLHFFNDDAQWASLIRHEK